MRPQANHVRNQASTRRTSPGRRIAGLGVAVAGLLAAAAAALAVTRAAPAPPAAPEAPIVVDLGSGVAEVTWLDVEFEDGYDVQRQKRKNNGRWFQTTIVATVGADTTSIEDTAGTNTFRYRVRAFNVDGDSAWSGWTEVTLAEGGGGDPPGDVWMAWYVNPPEFTPIAPVVENMGPQLGCVINGNQGPASLLHVQNNDARSHFDQGGWPDFGGAQHPCDDCHSCGMTVTPTDVCQNGAPTYPLDLAYAFNLVGDGTGDVWFQFLASGDPPGPKKQKRFDSEMVLVQGIVVDDLNDPDSAFTLQIRQPCLMLDTQTGPSDPRYIAIGDIRFEKWTAP